MVEKTNLGRGVQLARLARGVSRPRNGQKSSSGLPALCLPRRPASTTPRPGWPIAARPPTCRAPGQGEAPRPLGLAPHRLPRLGLAPDRALRLGLPLRLGFAPRMRPCWASRFGRARCQRSELPIPVDRGAQPLGLVPAFSTPRRQAVGCASVGFLDAGQRCASGRRAGQRQCMSSLCPGSIEAPRYHVAGPDRCRATLRIHKTETSSPRLTEIREQDCSGLTKVKIPRYTGIASFQGCYTDILQNQRLCGSEAATTWFYQGIICLWHYPVLGRPLARTGLQTVDPALQDEGNDGSAAWLQCADVTRVQLMTWSTVRQDPSSHICYSKQCFLSPCPLGSPI